MATGVDFLLFWRVGSILKRKNRSYFLLNVFSSHARESYIKIGNSNRKEKTILKKEGKQDKQHTEEPQEELETVKDITKIENGQPVPQPKDYDEIEY
ncbi:hypothetical protein RFW18_17480 [Metabacillus idriensis]|uniref:hypothetical protein n=1 Tax=Metabacillus idriensis TaxID=324768 RepID=UPI0028146F97|nr:hypothetical protein [Metabacillus idriensis]MDR0139549.1 hypothetical protein [Metabacillus idriensis]